MMVMLVGIGSLITLYGMRQVLFICSRLFGRQRHPYADIGADMDCTDWPIVTVMIVARDHGESIACCIDALLDTSYPEDRMRIVVVNDRSQDDTRDIVDRYAARHAGRVTAYHRISDKTGKSAALKDAMRFAVGDIVITVDADCIPGRGLLKQLAAPFHDPEVGAVSGRATPATTPVNLLTRLLGLERAGAEQIGRQARMNLKLVPESGGSVGGVRRSAVAAIGGWHDDVLDEATEISFRLSLNGWKSVHAQHLDCCTRLPHRWDAHVRQSRQKSMGQYQVLKRYWFEYATSAHITSRERLDGMLMMLGFTMPLLMLAGWLLLILQYFEYANALPPSYLAVSALMALGTAGNLAAFLDIGVAVILDGNPARLRLLPGNLVIFLVAMVSAAGAAWSTFIHWVLPGKPKSDQPVSSRLAGLR